MWRQPLVTILMLIIAMILTLPMRAQQKPVGPGLSPARADVAASLPRHGGVKPPLRNVGPSGAGPRPNAVRPYVACAAAVSALPPRAQQKPFTQEQVVSMVRDGFGDESGAELIEQRGIDFAPSEDFLQSLKTAGASEAFLKALRAAKPLRDQHGRISGALCSGLYIGIKI